MCNMWKGGQLLKFRVAKLQRIFNQEFDQTWTMQSSQSNTIQCIADKADIRSYVPSISSKESFDWSPSMASCTKFVRRSKKRAVVGNCRVYFHKRAWLGSRSLSRTFVAVANVNLRSKDPSLARIHHQIPDITPYHHALSTSCLAQSWTPSNIVIDSSLPLTSPASPSPLHLPSTVKLIYLTSFITPSTPNWHQLQPQTWLPLQTPTPRSIYPPSRSPQLATRTRSQMSRASKLPSSMTRTTSTSSTHWRTSGPYGSPSHRVER